MSDAEFHAYWYALQKALANKTPVPPFHDGKPQGGCYLIKYKHPDNPVPVRISRENGEIIVLVDGIKSTSHNGVWMSCGRTPATWDAYLHRMKHGTWPYPSSGATSGIGDNSGAELPLPERVTLETSKALAWLEAISGTIKTEQQAHDAANVADEIAKLCLKLEKVHEEEKAPHWAECKRLDAELLDPAKKGREVSVRLKRLVGKFADAAKEAARKRQEAHDIKAVEILNRGFEPPAAPTPPPTSFGTTGRKVNISAKLVAKVTDFDKVYHFSRDEPELKALLQKFAQRAVDGGVLPPGVERVEETSVR